MPYGVQEGMQEELQEGMQEGTQDGLPEDMHEGVQGGMQEGTQDTAGGQAKVYLEATHKLFLRAWKSDHIQHCGDTWQPLFCYTLQPPCPTCALNTMAASLTLITSVTLNRMAAGVILTTIVALSQPTNPGIQMACINRAACRLDQGVAAEACI